MVTLLTIVHIVVCLFLILVVLLQAGKGGGMGIAFGGAGSQTVFGSSGAGNFLTRLTSITAALFLLTSLALAHYSSRQDSKRLQDLASQRASEKKTDEEKAAKLKADLEKSRPATAATDGGAAVQAPGGPTGTSAPGAAPPGAGSTTVTEPGATPPAPSSAQLPAKLLQLKKPELTKPDVPGKTRVKPVTEAAPEGAAPPADAPKRPIRVKPAAPKPAARAAEPGEAPAALAAPAE
jgi:preprotein translocase subunit SecG